MKTMTLRGALSAFVLAAMSAATPVLADGGHTRVIGEKIDSGLGALPPYAQWLDKSGRTPMSGRVAGEKQDSGLGELPVYAKWLDKSGRFPMGTHVAGESLDSGLGSLPHYRDWKDRTGRDPMGHGATHVADAKR